MRSRRWRRISTWVSLFDPGETGGTEALQPDYYLTLMRQNLKNLESAFAGQSTVILPIQAQISTIAFIAHPIELGFRRNRLRETVLIVERLTVYRETYAAVQDVSFSLEEGTDMALRSEWCRKEYADSGNFGYLAPAVGEVYFLGQPCNSANQLASRLLQQIAYLPQNFCLIAASGLRWKNCWDGIV